MLNLTAYPFGTDKRRMGALWCSNNRMRLIFRCQKPVCVPLFTQLKFWNSYQYFPDLSDLLAFYCVFFVIT